MNITLSLTIEQINTILRALDGAPHGQVRQIVDTIITEATKQQQAAQAAIAAAREEVE